MNEQELRSRLQQEIPEMNEVPESFHSAMEQTLAQIVREEAQARRPALRARRTLALALVMVLLAATAAVAAWHWNTFDALSMLTGENPANADWVMQADLAQTTVNGVEITVTEAGYDGRMLFVRYSYRLPGVEHAFGIYEDGQLAEGIRQEDAELLRQYNVGWWTDNFWIDGQNMDMFAGSASVTSGSDVPGEIVTTEYWRLDVGGVQLKDRVTISLPIGAKPDTSKYFPLFEHPEWKDENGNFKMPDEGLVSFELDTGDMLGKVVTETPCIPLELPEVTAQVTEAAYSPLMTYITLKLEGDPEALAAYKAEHGEGWKDENGELIMPYTAMDVHGDWAGSLHLVDGQGRELFPGVSGLSGLGDEWTEYLYPHIADIPDELWLAPMEGGTADLTRAVRVR